MSLLWGLKLTSKYFSGILTLLVMADMSGIEIDRALKFSLTEQGTPELKFKRSENEISTP